MTSVWVGLPNPDFSRVYLDVVEVVMVRKNCWVIKRSMQVPIYKCLILCTIAHNKSGLNMAFRGHINCSMLIEIMV